MAAPVETSRFARRQWSRRLRSARPWLFALLAVTVAFFAAWVVFFSSWLATQHVSVEGTSTVRDRDVVEIAGVDLGTPLVRVDLDAVRDKVASLPAVADVSVHRSWPHTLEITVTERKPLATVLRHGTWFAMDKTGALFRPSTSRDPALPIVAFAPDADDAARAEVASVVRALPRGLLSSMRRVKARSMDSISLVLADGRQVRWGSADESDRKVEVLAILLKQRASVYDVSVPEEPTTRR
jgi:cell division protein FtsQ